MQPGDALEGKIPVFAFPPSLDFYLADYTTHKRIVTVYNPYDFGVRFQVLCTAPDKFQVVNPVGFIKEKCSVDILVRHIALKNLNCNVTDRLRIQMQHHTTKMVLGKKDIPATLHSGIPDIKESKDNESTGSIERSADWDISNYREHKENQRRGSLNPIVLVVGVICIAVLLLPVDGNSYLQLPKDLKLVCSYVLGLVTMAVLRP